MENNEQIDSYKGENGDKKEIDINDDRIVIRNHTADFLKGMGIIFVLITQFSWNSLERLNPFFLI